MEGATTTKAYLTEDRLTLRLDFTDAWEVTAVYTFNKSDVRDLINFLRQEQDKMLDIEQKEND